MFLAFFVPAIGFGSIIFILIAAIKDQLTPKRIWKCQVCQKLEPDMLFQDKQGWPLCREHLLPKYSDLFLKNTFRVVMVEFTDFKFKDPDLAAFTYYPLSYYKDYIGNPQILKQLLDSIDSHKCAKCGGKATILFVNKEDAVRDKDYIIPSTEYLTKGNYLCNEHALDRIKPALEGYLNSITGNGEIWLPYREDGFQRADEP